MFKAADRLPVSWIVLAASLLLLTEAVWSQPPKPAGQDAAGDRGDSNLVKVFQPAPSDVRRPLTLAERAIEEGRYADAAYQLGQLLLAESADNAETQDYFLENSDEDRVVQEGLKSRASDLVASLPLEGQQAYELQFGSQARALLNDALDRGDPGKLAELIRGFLHTRAGQQATLLAGRWELLHGRPMAAAVCLQRLARLPQASELDPELSLLLAASWLHAGMPERGEVVLLALKERQSDARIRVGNRDVNLFSTAAEALPWLRQLLEIETEPRGPRVAEWAIYRGNGQRNAESRGGLPTANYRWLVPTAIDRDDEKRIDAITRRLSAEGVAALPAMQPLALGTTVLTRTPSKLLGVDFESGKRIWVWPPWEEESFGGITGPLSGSQVSPEFAREDELNQRIWEDAASGQISSDGERVYLLHELHQAAPLDVNLQRVLIIRGAMQNFPAVEAAQNQLVALSLARQGAAEWIVGGEGGEDEPRLAGAYFLGPPLPMGDCLYALAEFKGEIRLVVLNARSGRLHWQQQLAHVDTLTVQVDFARRLAGASPSCDGGVLLCPTGAGVLVAVDVATRSLMWGYRYLKLPDRSQTGFGMAQVPMMKSRSIGDRWADATVTVAQGRVLVTALESNDLHCLDLLTGQPAWELQPRGDRLFLACVHGGKAVFAGIQQVSAIRLTDGEPAWSQPIPLDAPPSGRGFCSDGAYFLPTQAAELLRIDLEQGRIDRRAPTAISLGNLLCFRDQIVSQGPDYLSVFYQGDPLRRQVERTLAENAQDAPALAQFGELMLHDGKRPAAIEAFRASLRLDPAQDAARDLLVATLLEELHDHFTGDAERLQEIDQLIDRPAQRSRYLRLVARGWQEQGQLRRAFDAYLDLAALKTEMVESGAAAEMEIESVDHHLSVRMDRWIQTRIGELLAAAESADREYMDAAIRKAFAEATAAGEMSGFRRFLQIFAAHPLAEQMLATVADRLIDTREWLDAELTLARLATSLDPAVRATALAATARLMVACRQFEQAVACYERLHREFPERVCDRGQTGQQLYGDARQNGLLGPAWAATAPWPQGDVEVSRSADRVSRYPSYIRVYPVPLVQREGAVDPGLSVSFNQSRSSLVVRAADGNVVATVHLGASRLTTSDFSLTHARILGHLLLVSLGNELVAIDLLEAPQEPAESVLWRVDLLHSAQAVELQRSNVPVLRLDLPWGATRRMFGDAEERLVGRTGGLIPGGFFYFDSRELVCADPLNGAILWTRSGLPQGCDVFADRELLFVVPPASDKAWVFSAQDGRELGERPVAPLKQRWATWGRHVLSWEQEQGEGSVSLRLMDAWDQREIWCEELPASARAALVDCDEVAILQSEGRLVIRSLGNDRIALSAQLEPEPSLASVYVLRSSTQYLVATSREEAAESNSVQARITSIQSGSAAPLITGRLYAFGRDGGQPAWQAPTVIDRFGLPLDQPLESPALILIRHIIPETGATMTTRQHTSVMALDRRDGRVLLPPEEIPVQTFSFDILASRAERSVLIGLPVSNIRLTFGDTASEGEADAGREPTSAKGEAEGGEAR